MLSIDQLPWVVRLSAPKKLAMVLIICILLYTLLPRSTTVSGRILMCWDVGGMLYLALGWMTIVQADAAMTRLRAQQYDQSGFVIFVLVGAAAWASVIAIALVIGETKQLPVAERRPHLVLSIAALLFSWLLIQTLFAFHYAREYYATADADTVQAGLRFPGIDAPDYTDFAYYAFVVGMTSQVSDVVITSRSMRHTTLLHGILSFFFNIVIFAMSVNIVSGAL